MEHIDQLVNYIKQHLNQGATEEQIRQTLAQHHWQDTMVDQAFKAVHMPPPPVFQATTDEAIPVSSPQHTSAPTSAFTPFQQPSADKATPTKKKYRVFRAIVDLFGAIKRNAMVYVYVVLLSYTSAFISFFILGLLLDKVIFTKTIFVPSTSYLVTSFIVNTIVFTAWYVFAFALISAVTSLAIDDGSAGRTSSFMATIKLGLSKTLRVAHANVLFTVICYWPMVLLIFLPLLLLAQTSGGAAGLMLIPVFFLAGVAWFYIALVRYSLAPLVALFEPDVPIKRTLGRSKTLLKSGGQWFLLKGMLLILAILILLSLVTHQSLSELTQSKNIFTNLLLFVITTIINGVMVMLYRNRAAIIGS